MHQAQHAFESLLHRYLTRFPDEATAIRAVSRTIASAPRPFHRDTLPAHVTASGLVLRDGCLLLIWHDRLGRWLQPGGHVEEGETPLQAALREVLEETGYVCACHARQQAEVPLDIDVHQIPAMPGGDPAHTHIDMRYVLVAKARSGPDGHHRSAWRALAHLPPDIAPRTRRKLGQVL